MEWQVVLALVIAIPIVLFPAVFIWYLNVGGIFQSITEARARKRSTKKAAAVGVKEE